MPKKTSLIFSSAFRFSQTCRVSGCLSGSLLRSSWRLDQLQAHSFLTTFPKP